MVWFAFSTDLDSGRRPQRSHAKNCDHTIRVPDFRTPGLRLWISSRNIRIYIFVRAGWTGSQPWASPSTLASSCRQGRGLDVNRVTGMVVLATRRRLAPSGQQTSRADGPATGARDEHACCRSIPHVSVCELKKLGRAVRL